MNLLEELNETQRLAVLNFSQPLLIIAGPGSGKTRVIAYKIAYLLKEKPIPFNKILAVTFTNKAADEMRERVFALAGGACEKVEVSTFHALGSKILRKFSHPPLKTIFDRDDQISLLRQILEDLDFKSGREDAKRMVAKISRAKMRLVYPEAEDYLLSMGFTSEEINVYRHYQQRLENIYAADFDDLISKVVLLLESNPQLRSFLQETYSYVLVDEFQDTNPNQYELVKLIAGHGRLCVVGDEDQSIYGWRGATIDHMFEFQRDFPDCKLIFLDVNYRSPRTFLTAASAVISRNRKRYPKQLKSVKDENSPIYLKHNYSREEEAEFIAQLLKALEVHKELFPAAIFYRANYQSRVLEEKLSLYGIRYCIIGAVGFFERKEIKDLMAFLAFSFNHQDSVSFTRAINIKPMGLGRATLNKILSRVSQGYSPIQASKQLVEKGEIKGQKGEQLLAFVEMLEEVSRLALSGRLKRALQLVIDRLDYYDYLEGVDPSGSRRENVEELLSIAEEAEKLSMDLESFLERASLTSSLDEKTDTPVILSTLHAAKGLEFPTVIIASVDRDFIPHRKSLSADELEEERRLFYVGMTRAKKMLFLSTSTPFPSPFLEEIPSHFLEEVKFPGEVLHRRVRYVKHPIFGVGKVISSDEKKVIVEMEDGRVFTFMKDYVDLEPLD